MKILFLILDGLILLGLFLLALRYILYRKAQRDRASRPD